MVMIMMLLQMIMLVIRQFLEDGKCGLFTLWLYFCMQAKFEDGLPSERQSKIHLVDLAGRLVLKE